MRNTLRIISFQLATLAICLSPALAQNDDWHNRHGGPNGPAGRPPGPPPGHPAGPPPGPVRPPPGQQAGPGYRPPPGQPGSWGHGPPGGWGHGPSGPPGGGWAHGPPPGWAHGPPPGPGFRPPGFAGGYRPYPGADTWRTGAWRREWHDGRFGWWWAVGPSWYAFDAPVYPYPAYTASVEIVPPPTILVEPPAPLPPGPAPTQFWYYCQDPAGYFPYVSSCNGGWQEVSANPTR